MGVAVGESKSASVVNSTAEFIGLDGIIVTGNARAILVGRNLGTLVELCTLNAVTFLTVVTLLSKNS